MAANSTRFRGMTRLMIASRDGDLAAVRSLLKEGANVNATRIDPIHGVRGGDHRTSLMFASEKGHIDIVNELLSAGANPNMKSVGTKLAYNVSGNTFNIMRSKYFKECSGCTALMFASKEGHLDVVKALLAHKADPEIKDVHDLIPLDLAIAAGHEKIVQVLAGESHVKPGKLLGYFEEKKAALNAKRAAERASWKKRGYTELTIAILDRNLPHVRELLKSGVDPNEITEYLGSAPLIVACKKGELEIARELIEHGADITLPDENKYTALMFASQINHLDLVKLLLKTAEEHFVFQGEVKDYVNIATPFEENDACEAGFTALMFADEIEVIRELIKCGADLNHVNYGKMTVLMRACRDRKEELVTELCEHGADVNLAEDDPGEETDGYTPLHYAASSDGSVNMINTLCKHGANVNAKDANGNTPLMRACIESLDYSSNDYHLVAKELVRCGANPRLKADDGSTALDLLQGDEGSKIYMVVEAASHPTPKVAKRRGRSLVTRRNRRNTRLSEENMLERWEGRSKKRHTRSLNRR